MRSALTSLSRRAEAATKLSSSTATDTCSTTCTKACEFEAFFGWLCRSFIDYGRGQGLEEKTEEKGRRGGQAVGRECSGKLPRIVST